MFSEWLEAYAKFLRGTLAGMREEAARKQLSPGGPMNIAKVFAARHVSHDKPASFGYAAFGFEDILFVDVIVEPYDGEHSLMRPLVIRDTRGRCLRRAPEVCLFCRKASIAKPHPRRS
jgi:hypothetical protein